MVIIHPHDPAIHHVGGLGTYINNFVKYAPADFEVRLIGVSNDPYARPVGRWQSCAVHGRTIDFFPLVNAHPTYHGRFPLSVRFTLELARRRRELRLENAILELHRIEPALALRDIRGARKVLFFHTHSADLYNRKTEVFWKHFPWLYFGLEDRLMRSIDQLYSVRRDLIGWYRKRRPHWPQPFDFLPTWVDDEVFRSHPEDPRRAWRAQLAHAHGFDAGAELVLFVGRFELQKDPMLLLEAFGELHAGNPRSVLVMIGGGSMEAQIRAWLARRSLPVILVPPSPAPEVARWMNVADCLALSSAFEGMPRVLVEALHCGLPAVAYDEEGTRMLLGERTAGLLVSERTPRAFAGAVARVLAREPDRDACRAVSSPFAARSILGGLFERYRALARGHA